MSRFKKALAISILIGTGGAAWAGDLSWGCAFDKVSGRTFCLEISDKTLRNTGRIVASPPNTLLPGVYHRYDGRTVTVVRTGPEVGRQPFYWEE